MSGGSGQSPMGFRSLLPFLLLLTLGPPSPAQAQEVVGQLLDSDAKLPIPGALVQLVNLQGEDVAGFLSNDEGRFLLRAPGTGRYRIRAERIGYTTGWSAEFAADTSGTTYMDLALLPEPVALSELHVETDQVCHIRPEDALGVARVWEEVRKALTIQDWAARERLHRFRISQFDSRLDTDGTVISTESVEEEGYFDHVPFLSLPVEDLQARGYIQQPNRQQVEYYAPDASVLISELFLDTHCLRLAEEGDRDDLIGVAFEPVKLGLEQDIEGVLWVDRASAELRYLDFRYTPNYWRKRALAGGRVEFDRLPDGSWVVHRWAIRMPTRKGYQEVGAEILGVQGR